MAKWKRGRFLVRCWHGWEKEAWRDPVRGKADIHYPSFDTVVNRLNFLGISSGIFLDDVGWEEVISEGKSLEQEVVKKTLARVDDVDLKEVLGEVAGYLGEEDVLRISDLIFVFGSKSLSRIQKAVKLYKGGLAPKIFITGGHPFYEQGEPEAQVFRGYAVERGVPEKDIIVEPESITVADNVRRSLNLFDKMGMKYLNMILVTAWFAQRRSWAFMMKYISEDQVLYRVNSPVKPGGEYTPDR